jgi:stage III sporulation protein AG
LTRGKEGKSLVMVSKLPFLKPEYLKLALVGVLGIILIVAGSLMSKPGKETASEDRILSELRQYQDTLAREIEKTVSAIQGAGKVLVSVTLETGPETVYVRNISISKNAQSETTPQGQERQTITESETAQAVTGRGTSTGDFLVPEMIIAPKVSGCLVISEGASVPKVKASIYRAVQVLLDIPIYRIEVLPMQGGK